MTIAAGFNASDGILLCADMLVTDGYTKEYKSKVYTWQGNGISVCLGIAGHVGMAMMAAEGCVLALQALNWDHQAFSDVYGTLALVIRDVQHEYVDKVPAEERDRSRFYMLIGIYTENAGHRLYNVSDATLAPVHGFECIGSGRSFGIHIIKPSYDKSKTINDLSIIAMHAFAAAKERCDGVGGRSQFVALRRGAISSVLEIEAERGEANILEFEKKFSGLLSSIYDKNLSAPAFEEHLNAFSEEARFLHANWQGRGFEHLEKWLTKQEEKLDPQSTTGDASRQQPSQE
jgi:20S proteasome alpha/beta subunit